MIATEAKVKQAAELYKMRDSAKAVLGADYMPTMRQTGKAIKGVAAELKCSDLAAAIRMTKEAGVDGFAVIMILAALVELVEPSQTPNAELTGRTRSGSAPG